MRTLLLGFLVLLPSLGFAMWAMVPLEQLIQDSDIVVVGTLQDVKEWAEADGDHGKGDIAVEEVLWGDAKPKTKLSLVWANSSLLACPRVEWRGTEGKKAIWLLKRGEKGEVKADYPGRFVPLEQRAEVIKLLEARKKKT